MLSGKQASEWVKPALYIGGAWLGWKYALSPLLETLGLKDSKAEVDAEKLRQEVENASGSKDYWNPNWWNLPVDQFPIKGVKSVQLLTQAAAKDSVNKLWDATGFFNDDEEAIYAVFRSLKYKSQVSFLAYWFNALKGKDLYQWLRDYLNDKELNVVLQITQKMPWGLVTTIGIQGIPRKIRF